MDFKTANVEGLRLFYREAGDLSEADSRPAAWAHSSSSQFHGFIPFALDENADAIAQAIIEAFSR